MHLKLELFEFDLRFSAFLHERAQVAQARYMSSSMWTFALLRDSSDLHIYEDLYGERNKPEKKRKITVEITIKTTYLNSSSAFFVCCVIF